MKHLNTLETTEKKNLVLEGTGGDRFKVNSACPTGRRRATGGEAVLVLIEKVVRPN